MLQILVPLLVPLRTGILYIAVRQGAMWIINIDYSFFATYPIGCGSVQISAKGTKKDLKSADLKPMLGSSAAFLATSPRARWE